MSETIVFIHGAWMTRCAGSRSALFESKDTSAWRRSGRTRSSSVAELRADRVGARRPRGREIVDHYRRASDGDGSRHPHRSLLRGRFAQSCWTAGWARPELPSIRRRRAVSGRYGPTGLRANCCRAAAPRRVWHQVVALSFLEPSATPSSTRCPKTSRRPPTRVRSCRSRGASSSKRRWPRCARARLPASTFATGGARRCCWLPVGRITSCRRGGTGSTTASIASTARRRKAMVPRMSSSCSSAT